jgi:hypothetical protein
VRISERIEAERRQGHVLARVSRAAWRLDQAERERRWVLASAHAEGISIRTLATAAGLSPSRVPQLVAAVDLDALDAALGELRAVGWPAPEDPDSDEDTELDGRPAEVADSDLAALHVVPWTMSAPVRSFQFARAAADRLGLAVQMCALCFLGSSLPT